MVHRHWRGLPLALLLASGIGAAPLVARAASPSLPSYTDNSGATTDAVGVGVLGQAGSTAIGASTGFQQITAVSTATKVTPPTGSRWCYVQVETGTLRYRTDGVAPTASIGRELTAPPDVLAISAALMANTKFIPSTGSVTLDIDCYQ